jgi:hypothetical protein
MKTEKLVGAALLIVLALIVAPIAVYIYTFGFTINDRENAWAAMGSAMSGIYGPMLAVLTLILLTMQLLFQRESTRLQQETTKHMHDQTHIQAANEQIAYYLGRLDKACQEKEQDGRTVAQRLIDQFAFPPTADIRGPAQIAAAKQFDAQNPQLFATWNAYQCVLSGLSAVDGAPYDVSLTTSQQKAIVTMSYALCVALDNGVWCASEGRLPGPYRFARIPS